MSESPERVSSIPFRFTLGFLFGLTFVCAVTFACGKYFEELGASFGFVGASSFCIGSYGLRQALSGREGTPRLCLAASLLWLGIALTVFAMFIRLFVQSYFVHGWGWWR